MNIPAVDLGAQYKAVQSEVDSAVARVFASQHFILGEEVQQFEDAVADYCGSPHACGVSSGTDALLLSLLAEGIGPGDEVITTPFTFIATAGSIARTGATIVFADIEKETFTIDPKAVAQKITPRTKAVLPVHLFGQMADMDAILEIAASKDIFVIEDAAQAMGASSEGRMAGTLGAYGCFSFFPSKNLGGAGDGGMILTADPERDARLRLLRAHGIKQKTEAMILGGNFRLDALQSAILGAKLPFLDAWMDARRSRAALYRELLSRTPLVRLEKIVLPVMLYGDHSWNQYVVRVGNRDAVHKVMQEKGIDARIYYPLPLHLHHAFANLGYTVGDFPVSEKAAEECLSLPLYPELLDRQVEYVVDTLVSALS